MAPAFQTRAPWHQSSETLAVPLQPHLCPSDYLFWSTHPFGSDQAALLLDQSSVELLSGARFVLPPPPWCEVLYSYTMF